MASTSSSRTGVLLPGEKAQHTVTTDINTRRDFIFPGVEVA